jgi:hypothetical protein
MPYKDQVICFSGGLTEYIGVLDQAPHKMGENWYRILEPCQMVNRQVGNQSQIGLVAIQGAGDHYKRYVDIRVPRDSIIEIRTLDPQGDLYQAYTKEKDRKKSKIIHAPGLSMPVAPGLIN